MDATVAGVAYTIRSHNLHHDGQGDPVMKVGATDYNCNQVAGY